MTILNRSTDRPFAITAGIRAVTLSVFMVFAMGTIASSGSATTNPVSQAVPTDKKGPVFVCPPCGCESDGTLFDKPGTCPSCGMGLVRKVDRKEPYKVAIVVFQGVELLDFAGPGETFAATHASNGHGFQVFTVATTTQPITSQGFLTVVPKYSITDCPKPDIVVIPGGNIGSVTKSPEMMAWLKARGQDCEVMFSVCNGALALAALGLLDGLEATSHRSAIERLRQMAPKAKVVADKRVVDNGKIVTAAGVSAGIDGALHLVARLYGPEAAHNTAHYMEYRWTPSASNKALDHFQGAIKKANEQADFAGAVQSLRQSLEQGFEQPSTVLRHPGFAAMLKNPDRRIELRKLLAEHCRESLVEMVGLGEAGQRLTLALEFVNRDTGKPITDSRVYLYQTDEQGDYAPEADQPGGGSNNPRLFAFALTNNLGQITIQSILPGAYRGTRTPRHIHLQIDRAGARAYGTAIYFDGDPPADEEIRTDAARGRVSLIPPKSEGGKLLGRATIQVPIG